MPPKKGKSDKSQSKEPSMLFKGLASIFADNHVPSDGEIDQLVGNIDELKLVNAAIGLMGRGLGHLRNKESVRAQVFLKMAEAFIEKALQKDFNDNSKEYLILMQKEISVLINDAEQSKENIQQATSVSNKPLLGRSILPDNSALQQANLQVESGWAVAVKGNRTAACVAFAHALRIIQHAKKCSLKADENKFVLVTERMVMVGLRENATNIRQMKVAGEEGVAIGLPEEFKETKLEAVQSAVTNTSTQDQRKPMPPKTKSSVKSQQVGMSLSSVLQAAHGKEVLGELEITLKDGIPQVDDNEIEKLLQNISHQRHLIVALAKKFFENGQIHLRNKDEDHEQEIAQGYFQLTKRFIEKALGKKVDSPTKSILQGLLVKAIRLLKLLNGKVKKNDGKSAEIKTDAQVKTVSAKDHPVFEQANVCLATGCLFQSQGNINEAHKAFKKGFSLVAQVKPLLEKFPLANQKVIYWEEALLAGMFQTQPEFTKPIVTELTGNAQGEVQLAGNIPAVSHPKDVDVQQKETAEEKDDEEFNFVYLSKEEPKFCNAVTNAEHFRPINAASVNMKKKAKAFFHRGELFLRCSTYFIGMLDCTSLGLNFFSKLTAQDWQQARKYNEKENCLSTEEVAQVDKFLQYGDQLPSGTPVKKMKAGESLRKEVSALIQKGKAFFPKQIEACENHFEMALTKIREFKANSPSTNKSQFVLAHLYYEYALLCQAKGNEIRAFEMFSTAILCDPKHAKAMFEQGKLYHKFAEDLQAMKHGALATKLMDEARSSLHCALKVPQWDDQTDLTKAQKTEAEKLINSELKIGSETKLDAGEVKMAVPQAPVVLVATTKVEVRTAQNPINVPKNPAAERTEEEKQREQRELQLQLENKQREQQLEENRMKLLELRGFLSKRANNAFEKKKFDRAFQLYKEAEKSAESIQDATTEKEIIQQRLAAIAQQQKVIQEAAEQALQKNLHLGKLLSEAKQFFDAEEFLKARSVYEQAEKFIAEMQNVDGEKMLIKQQLDFINSKLITAQQILGEIVRLGDESKEEINPAFLKAFEGRIIGLTKLTHKDFAEEKACHSLIPKILANQRSFEILIKTPSVLKLIFPEFAVSLEKVQSKMIECLKDINFGKFGYGSALILAATHLVDARYKDCITEGVLQKSLRQAFNMMVGNQTAKLLMACNPQGVWESETFKYYQELISQFRPLLYVYSQKPQTDAGNVAQVHYSNPANMMYYAVYPGYQQYGYSAPAVLPDQQATQVFPQPR